MEGKKEEKLLFVDRNDFVKKTREWIEVERQAEIDENKTFQVCLSMFSNFKRKL